MVDIRVGNGPAGPVDIAKRDSGGLHMKASMTSIAITEVLAR
jgi:hypothetical protein